MGLAPAEAGAGRPARRPGGTWRRWARLTGLAAWIALVLAAAMPHPAQAYIDPATTSYLIQVVSGLVITLSVAIGVFFRRIVLFLTTARARLAATWVRLTSPRRRPAKGSAAQAAANPSPTASALAAGAAAGPRGAAERDSRRFAARVAVVESAASRPISATGGAAGMKADGIGQAEAAGDGAGPGAAQTGQAGQAGGQWAFWWRDARPFRRRLGLAGAAAVAPAFLLFIFGPLDIFQKNAAEFPFTAADLLKPMLVVFGLAALVMLGALAALRGRVFDLAVSLLLGLTLAAWVQGTFLNTDYGELTGVAIRWERYARLALANTAIWAALTAAPLILRLVSRKIWTVAAWLAPAALVLSCAAALGSDYASLSASGQPERQALAPTYAGLFTASSAANQYIFVLDMMDQKFVTEIEAEDPEFFSRHLDGFTQFDANISNYTRTLPSAADMLTGQRYQFDEPLDQYFGRAYKHGDFLPNLRAAGYSTNIYATDRYSYFNINDIVGFADNVKPAKRRIALKPMLKGMLLLDAFRYAPHIAKPFFWTAADQFAGAAPVLDPDSPFTSDNFAFKELLAAEGVTLGGDQPRFSYIHLDGAHNPAIMDRQANRVPRDSVSLTEQAMGAFSLAFAYLDQLKRIGAYKGASIVITADHGHWTEDADAGPLAAPRLTALFVKPAGAEGAPLAHSLAPTQMENVRATLLAEAGARPSGGPPTVFELSADSAEPRDFFYRRGQNVDEGLIDHWQVTGDARNWENWHFVAGNRTLYWG